MNRINTHFVFIVKLFLIVPILVCLVASSAEALEITGLEPGWVAIGDDVKLNGIGFDPNVSYTLTVAGVPAVVQEVQTTFIRFTVPAGATTGPVAVDDVLEVEGGVEARLDGHVDAEALQPGGEEEPVRRVVQQHQVV